MQFKTCPDTENLFRWSVLPDDFIRDMNQSALLVASAATGSMNGSRFYQFNVADNRLIVWLLVPLAIYYDYYRLGGMLAGAAPQNLFVNLHVTGNGIVVTPGVNDMAKFRVTAYFRNIGDNLGALPAGMTPYNADLVIDPATLAGEYLLQKVVGGPIFISAGAADKSDGVLVIKIERLAAGNTYLDTVRLYSATVDMGIVR